MDDLVPDIDRGAIAADGFLDDADGTIHASAKTAGSGKNDAE
jgi:hypothetical protein